MLTDKQIEKFLGLDQTEEVLEFMEKKGIYFMTDFFRGTYTSGGDLTGGLSVKEVLRYLEDPKRTEAQFNVECRAATRSRRREKKA